VNTGALRRRSRARWHALAALAIGASLVGGAASAATPTTSGRPPQVTAAAYLVIGNLDGRELAARSADEPRPVASITKLMTVLVALRNASPEAIVTVPAAAARVGESSISLRAGERMTVRDLAIAALVPSANDAATALALHAGRGSLPRFVAMMNAEARSLGLKNTRFRNPHGLDESGHVSTARDVVTLLRAALEVPVIRRYAAAREATISGGRVVESTDGLLARVRGLVGAKTGHTGGAGWSQVAVVRRGSVEVTAALLGAPDEETRNAGLEALLEWGLSRYVPVRAVDADVVYARAEIGWGLDAIELRAAGTLVRTVALDVPLERRVLAPEALALPVRKGQRVGEVAVYVRGRLIARAPLLATRAVDRPGFFGRIGWYAGRSVDHVLDTFP
jgi:serine-type D-Ala-D-Ala carboxypeptidase (penicillin-binding protein 5/6)